MRITHPCRWVFAAVLLGLAVQPVMLPHPVWVQSVVGGAAGAQGYGLAALAGRLFQFAPIASFGARFRDRAALTPGIGLALSGAIVTVAMLIAHAGQVAAAGRTRMAAPTFLADALGAGGAVLFGVTVIALGLGLAAGLRWLGRGVRRRPRRFAALVLAPALVLAGSRATAAESPSPSSVGVSTFGSSAIGVSLEVKALDFLRQRPSPASITAVTGRPAQAPVRVYIGRHAASTAQRRAELAVRELDRVGGFDRAAVLINVPTGSGWVNPAAGSALEYLYGGDISTVVVQYSAAPSWIAYLRGGEGVQASTRALTDAIRARLNRIPVEHRPRLLAYGESLGAWGGLRAYDLDPHAPDAARGLGMARQTDGALWAGIPGGLLGTPPKGTRTLVHADDPVPAWGLPLFLHGSPVWPGRWLPVVSFWQATADVITSPLAPPGYGHRYGPELVDAWRPLVSTTGVPGAAPPDRLSAVRRAIGQ